MAYKLYIILLLALFAQPSMAQYNSDHKKLNEKFTPAKEGMPGYYDQNTRKLFKQGKWAEGHKLLVEGMKKYSTLSSLNELMGSYWMHYRQYDKARYYLIRSIRDNSDNVQSKQMLMKLEQITKHYSTAIVYCNELLEASPYDYTLWRKKIELYRLQGNDAEATRLLQRLSAIYPERAEVKKDIMWDYEQKYRSFKERKNLAGQEEMLRKLVEMNPKDAEFQMALCNLLLQTGRSEQAIDVAGYAATMVKSPYPFIEKKASILSGMTRYSEALAYLHGIQRTVPGAAAQLSRLTNNIEQDAARAAAQNDPYTAYGKIYEKTHSEEALNYLLNTSMSRGYLDDALMYIREARRRKGDTENLMMREFSVQRRMGNTKAATNMLERIHAKWPNNLDASEELCAIRLDEVRHMMDLAQYDEAAALLERLRTFKVDSETKNAVERRLFTCYVKTGQRKKALMQLERISQSPQMSAELYEEVALPYIKQLMAQGRLYKAEAEMLKVLEKDYYSSDALLIGINIAMQLKNNDKARMLVDIGRKRFPEEPAFMLKDAQLIASNGDNETAMKQFRSLLDTYIGDSTVVRAYADCCESLAIRQMKDKNYEEAMKLVDEAMQYYPESQSLILTKSMIYEAKKDWDNAIATYKRYKPGIGELDDYIMHMNTLKRHTLHNTIEVGYQMARPSSEDRISSMASLAYTKIMTNNSYTVSIGYAGRDGFSAPTNADESEGGTGIQLCGEWLHSWNSRLETNLILGYANKFFPRIRAELKGSYELPKDWTAKGGLSYRLIGSDAKTTLLSLGLGATKDLELFNLRADVNMFVMSGQHTNYFSGSFFVNGSVIAKCFPIEGSKTHLFLSGSVGNAPEISLVDNLMPVKFNQLNTMLGFGGQYVVNSMIDFGISGQWYTMAVKSSSAETKDNNKNYLYLNANVTIHF